MATLDDIIEQSFQDELNRFNKKKVKNGECNNVAELFKQVQTIKTECNICYDDAVNCIQCYQCDFKYCEKCLSKVISEFNKCSACQANFKDNYSQLKDKNKKTSINSNATATTYTSPANSNNSNDLLSDYEIEQLTLLLQMDNINIKSNSRTNKKNEIHKHQNYNNNNNNSKPNKFTNANTNINRYLDNDFDDEIESCQFQTINPNSRYNFRVQQNTDSNELIYICNNSNLYPIIINYKLLDKCFQRTVFICLVELIEKPNIFPNVWQTIAAMIYNFSCNYNSLIHNRNFKNQAFLYQKQDLINTINQMASYN